MLPWCPVLSKWAVNISKQHLLSFSLIKGTETTMQNSFWFLGAEGRFQEIKQTIRFGNSPKSGAFWPQNRGRQLSRSGALLIFPKDWQPGQGWVRVGVESPPRGGLEGLDTGWCPFPNRKPWIEMGWVGRSWTALPRPCPRGVRWHYWSILIYWLEVFALEDLKKPSFPKDWPQWQLETCSYRILWLTMGLHRN